MAMKLGRFVSYGYEIRTFCVLWLWN